MTTNNSSSNQIVGWAVCYVPTREGKLFAGLKTETIAAFHSQDDAIKYQESVERGGYIDEMHIGYRVYPLHWIPNGVKLN